MYETAVFAIIHY